MRRKLIITVCGVLLAVSMVAVAGAQNASDYPPIDVDTEVQELDENDSVNSTVGLDHARGYDDDALAVFDCSIMDCSDTTAGGNLSSAVSDHELYVKSTNNATVSFTQDDIEITTSGTNPSAVIGVDFGDMSNGTGGYHFESSGGEHAAVFNGSVTSYTSLLAGSFVGSVADHTEVDIYVNGSLQSTTSGSNISYQDGQRFRFTSNSTLSEVSQWDRTISGGEASLLHDEYRVGGFVPSEKTTTGRNLGENQSLTWNVSKLRDSEVTLKTQYYDGSNWVTDQELTVSNAGKFDVAVNNPGNEYRYITTPQSTVDSGGGGFFAGGSGDNTLYIFGFSFNQSNFMLGSGVAIVIGILAFFYPGMELFGRTES